MASVVLAGHNRPNVAATLHSQYQRGLVVLSTTREDGKEFVTACWPGQEREEIDRHGFGVSRVWRRDFFDFRFSDPNYFWCRVERYG